MLKILNCAVADIREGLGRAPLWIALAKEDINDQHRRTTLGPAWLFISYTMYVGSLFLVFGENSSIPNFIAYVSIGMVVFLFLQDVVFQSVSLFSREESFIGGTNLPMSIYILRMTMQSLIRFSYAATGCLIFVLVSGTPISLYWMVSILGLSLIFLALPAVITVLATCGAFFPDMQFVVANVIRVFIFLTPIFWQRSGGWRDRLYQWNPFTHFIEIVRLPITAHVVPYHSLVICLVITVLSWVAAIYLLGKYRKQIVFLIM